MSRPVAGAVLHLGPVEKAGEEASGEAGPVAQPSANLSPLRNLDRNKGRTRSQIRELIESGKFEGPRPSNLETGPEADIL